MSLLLVICGIVAITCGSLFVGMFSAIRHTFTKTHSLHEVDEVINKQVAMYLAIWLLGIVLVLVFR